MGKEKYEDYWKKKEQEKKAILNGSTTNSKRDRYEARWAQNYVSSLPSRLEDLSSRRKALYENYTSRFTDKDGNYINAYRGDTEDALTSFNSSKAYLDNESKAILDGLTKYGKYLDADKVKGIQDYLSSYSGDLDSMYKTYQTDHDYFSQWSDEESYNRAMTYAKEQEEKKNKYSAMSDDELNVEIERLKGSKKGSKLSNFAMMVVGAQEDVNSNTNLYATGKSNQAYNDSVDNDISLIEKEKTNRKYKQIDELPGDVKKLVDELTVIDSKNDDEEFANKANALLSGFTGGNNVNYNVASNSERYGEITKELENMGVTNWQELLEYNKLRYNAEKNASTKADYAEMAKEHPVLSSFVSIPASLGKGLGALEMIEHIGSDVPLDPNSPYFGMSDLVNTTRETVTDEHDAHLNTGNETIDNIDLFDELYGTAMSIGDSVVAGVGTSGLKGVGGAVLGLSAASDSAQEVAENGGSASEAITTGLVAGINEMLWESVSLGKLDELLTNGLPKRGFKTFVKETLKSMGINASEELNTEASNLLADYLINGGASTYSETVQNYLSMGYTGDEAKNQAKKDMLVQMGKAGVGGALQGLFMGGGAGGISTVADAIDNKVYENKFYNQQGQNIIDQGNLSQLVEETEALGNEKTLKSLKDLANQVSGVKTEDLDVKGSKKYAHQVGKLYKGVQKAQFKNLSKSSETAFKNVIKAELESSGADNVEATADILVKAMHNEGLTRAESKQFQAVNGHEILNKALSSAEFNKKLTIEEKKQFEESRDNILSTVDLTHDKGKTKILSDSDYNISSDGKTTIEATGEDVDILKIDSLDGDDISLSVESGDSKQVVLAGELRLNEDYVVILEGLKDIKADFGLDVSSANSILALWDGYNGDVVDFSKAMKSGIMYGQYNMRKDFDNSRMGRNVPDNIRNRMFEIGREYKKRATTEQDAHRKATADANASSIGDFSITFADDVKYKKLNKKQKAQIDMAQIIAQALGFNLEVFRSPKDALGRSMGEMGSYTIEGKKGSKYKTNTMRLDIDAATLDGKSLILFTQSHELTHFIKAWSLEKYQVFADFLVERYDKKGVPLETLIQEHINESKLEATAMLEKGEITAEEYEDAILTPDEAFEEAVCNACENFLADPKIQQAILDIAQKDITIAQKIKNFIKNLITRLDKALRGLESDSAEAKYVSSLDIDDIKKLKELWLEALKDAKKNVEVARERAVEEQNVLQAKENKADKNTIEKGDVKHRNRPVDSEVIHSMTMDEAKQMIQRAFVLGNIYEWYEGEYKNGDEWLREQGADEVALYIENEYALQQKYLDKIQGILDEEFYVQDILNAYLNGTLVGKEKPKAKRLDVDKNYRINDTRFYSPQRIENVKQLFEIAGQKLTAKNRAEVSSARAKILLFAHNKGASELLGLSQAELNKKLRSWSGYTNGARETSERLNRGVAESNKWTGIENCSWLYKNEVTTEELESLVKNIEGAADDYEKMYIARTMLALDTHIDWSWLSFEFDTNARVNQKHNGNSRILGFYRNDARKIVVSHNHPNTVAHEMGHALDYQWARDLGYGNYTALTDVSRTTKRITDTDTRQFFDNFKVFMDSLTDNGDIRSEYTQDPKEVFARFVARFVQWVDNTGGNRSYTTEVDYYNDKFTASNYIEFVKLLQEKAMLDAKKISNDTLAEDVKFKSRSYASTFYSQMGKVVETVKQDKLGASSVIPMLKGKGVKNEEIKWSGIEEFLEGKKSVTKQELQEFIAGSMLQIEEVEMGSGDLEFVNVGNGEYQIRFNDDYNTVINLQKEDDVWIDDHFGTQWNSLGDAYAHYNSQHTKTQTKWSDYKFDGGSNYRELVFLLPNSVYSNKMMRTHWGEDAKGILAHARTQDFVVHGKKMLFIEEIQSDWHNAGHKFGYDERVTKLDAIYRQMGKALHDFDDPNHMQKAANLRDEYHKLQSEIEASGKSVNGAPDAPFKENYHEYVLKRLLRIAAEEGYDSIGWTTADIQSQRWSDEYAEGYRIEYDQDIPKFLNKYGKKWGTKVGMSYIPLHTYGVYDAEERVAELERDIQQYRDEIEEYGEDSEYAMFAREGIADMQKSIEALKGTRVWSMEITDSMKESVLYEGQTMYKKRNYWRPKMSKTDFNQIDMMAKIELPKTDKYIDSITKWLYNTKNGKNYFAIYSTEDENDPTILYASLNNKAVIDCDFTKRILNIINIVGVSDDEQTEIGQSEIGQSGTFGEILNRIGSTTGLYVVRGGESLGRQADNGNVSVYSRASNSELSPALLNCLRNCYERGKAERLKNTTKRKNRPYQPSLEDLGIDYKEENERLKADADRLKEMLKLQGTVTHGKVLAKASYEGVAKKLLHSFGMKRVTDADLVKELVNRLDSFYSYIINEDDLMWDEMFDKSMDIAKWLDGKLPEQVVYKNPNAVEILRDIREKGIMLSDKQKEEAAYYAGSLSAYRKMNFGNFKIVNEGGISLTDLWEQIVSDYPGAISQEYIEQGEVAENLPSLIVEVVELMRQTENVINDDNRLSYLRDMAMEIYDSYWNIPTVKTLADKHQQKVNLLRSKHKEEMNALKEKKDTKLKNTKEYYQDMVRKIRADKDSKLDAYKERVQEQKKKNVEGRNKTATKNKIKRVIKTLESLYGNPTKEKNVKIEFQDMVKKALIMADAIFDSGNISSSDILSGNLTIRLGENERKKLDEWRKVYERRQDYRDKLDVLESSGKVNQKTHDELLDMISRCNKKLNALSRNLSDVVERQRAELNDNSVQVAIDSLVEAYKSLKDSTEGYAKAAYNDYVVNRLDTLKTSLKNTTVKTMTLTQLDEVYQAYKMVLTTVRTANELFVNNKRMSVTEMGEAVIREVENVAKPTDDKIAALRDIRKYSWEELKPIYAFERIGSKTLLELFKDARKGEDVLGRDVADAQSFFREKSKTYGYDSWDFDERKDFKLADGRTFNISLQEIMSIYAYSKREQALDHITKGGFVFDDKELFTDTKEKGLKGKIKKERTTVEAYRLNDDVFYKIINSLTKEQKKFIDDMQEYLSAVMGAKGNEVSRVLYGIDLFKEKYYFPLMSSNDFIQQTNNPVGEVALKNSGMAKATVPHARNPIVLQGFMDVWSGHVNKMSTYHAFVLPIENLNKVFNYTGYARDNRSVSVQTILKGVYGDAVNRYITNFITDLNGGIKTQSSGNWVTKGISRFKKTAVAASTSVVVQQPTAIVRAMAMINPKYFVHKSDGLKHNEAWEELKKYAPIAVVKEMGGFDVGSGRQVADYITAKEYKGKDKVKGFFTDSTYRDDALMWGATKADEFGWITIWNAVKREIADTTTHKVGSDEFLKACGERFTDIITYTQVYDSVFSRSGFMRNKGEISKMATSFMGEPTTSFNMLYNAVLQAKRGNISKGEMTKIMGATVSSIILASIAKSLIYALRDDDEDESYAEKYAQALTNSLSEDLFIPNMLPYVSDITSLLSGWDVERTDMAILKDFKDAVDDLDSSNKSLWRKIEDLGGAVAAFGGIPAKNVMRTVREMYNLMANVLDDNTPSASDVGDAIVETFTGETSSSDINEALEKGKTDKAKKIINDLVSDKIKQGKTEKEAKASIKSSVTSYWKELYLQAYRDKDNAEMLRIRRILQSTGLYDDVVETCSNWIKSMKDEKTTDTTFKKW